MSGFKKKIRSQPQRVSVVQVRALISKDLDPVTWDEDVWEDPQILQGVSHLRE